MTTIRPPARHGILPYLCLLYIPIALAVAELQLATTYDVGVGKAIFSGYLVDGQGAIFHARPLTRWIIGGTTGFLNTTPDWSNFWLQSLSMWLAMMTISIASLRIDPRCHPAAPSLLALAWLMFGFLSLGGRIAYPYDIPALFFSALALLALFSRSFPLMLLAVCAGSLNQETLVWMIPAWGLCRREEGTATRRAIMETAVLALVYTGIYIMLRLPSGGSSLLTVSAAIPSVEDPARSVSRLWRNILELCFQGHGRVRQNVYWPLSLYLAALCLGFRANREFRILAGCSLLYIATILVVGNIWETRLLNEVLPFSSLLVAHWLMKKHDAVA